MAAPPICCPGHGIACALRTVEADCPNVGRQYWCCPNFLQCNYFQWADGAERSAKESTQTSGKLWTVLFNKRDAKWPAHLRSPDEQCQVACDFSELLAVSALKVFSQDLQRELHLQPVVTETAFSRSQLPRYGDCIKVTTATHELTLGFGEDSGACTDILGRITSAQLATQIDEAQRGRAHAQAALSLHAQGLASLKAALSNSLATVNQDLVSATSQMENSQLQAQVLTFASERNASKARETDLQASLTNLQEMVKHLTHVPSAPRAAKTSGEEAANAAALAAAAGRGQGAPRMQAAEPRASSETKRGIIEAIRAEKLLVDVPAEFAGSVKSLHQSLQNSLQILAHDIYSSDTHFVKELIQNADDNKYSDPTPEWSLFISDGAVWTTNNEVGMVEKDVRSLCDIANSTKRGERMIGQKGVGETKLIC